MKSNELISRAAAIAQIKENYCDGCDHTDLCKSCETHDCIATIEQQVPAVDAIPVEWLEVHKMEYYEDLGVVPVAVVKALNMWQEEQEAR